MMTIPMENGKESSSRELVQHLFNKNVELEKTRRKAAQARIPSDPNTWQQMRENYEAIVLEDHAFSEKHDIEISLWQLHYRRIEELRAHFTAVLASAGSAASENVKGPGHSGPARLTKIRSQFKTFLSEATGFYHDLMLKIRAKYGLPLEYFPDDNQCPMYKDEKRSSEVEKGLISCHRCLIYLGDLARYKGLYGEADSKARDFAAASTYYMQASSLCSSNGNPHHQLAILAGYSNDELVSIYRYFRSLAVDNPFVTARDNLIIAFEKNRQNYTQLVGDGQPVKEKKQPSRVPGKGRGKGATRFSNKDIRVTTAVKDMVSDSVELLRAFTTRFIRLSGILFTRTSLETFHEVQSTVRKDLIKLLPSGPEEVLQFGSDAAECRLAVVRMIAILIFTVHNVNKESENQSNGEILQRSVLLQNALTGTFEFVGCMLERCKLLNDPSSSYLLPGIMIFIEWLACCPDIVVGSELEDEQMDARTYFWNNCISLLNTLLSNRSIFGNVHEEEMCFFNMSKYDESETANCVALPEDFELREFSPLLPAQVILDFSKKHSFYGEGGNKEKAIRVQRIVAAGKALVNIARIGEEAVFFDRKLNKFVTGSLPQVSSDDNLLTNPVEAYLNDTSEGISLGDELVYSHLTKEEFCADDEDEDEVIVFQPSTNEKHVDECTLNSTFSELPASIFGAGKTDVGKENNSFYDGHDSYFFQNGINISPWATVANVNSQHLLPVKPVTSKGLVVYAPEIDSLANSKLMENGSLQKSDQVDQFEVSEPAAFSLPYPHFASNAAGNNCSIQPPQTSVSSLFGSIMSSGLADNGVPMKPLSMSAVAPGLKKNPISRPVRHAGPPPGFACVPAKVLDESPKTIVKNDSPLVSQTEEYSWLDQYSLSSANHSVGLSSSFSQVGTTIPSLNKTYGSMGIASFPFPGKQVPYLEVPGGNLNDRKHYPFIDHMKPCDEKQQQFQKVNRQPVGPPQHQQSLWENNFFV